MGIPLDIFSLHCWQREAACQDYLLLRVEQPGYNNAIAADYAGAVETAENTRKAAIRIYTELLPIECPGAHRVSLVGELQADPTGGEELSQEYGGVFIDLWIAQPRFEYPWIVLDTAASEAAFWSEVEQDEISRLGARRPATKQRAYFLTENDVISKGR